MWQSAGPHVLFDERDERAYPVDSVEHSAERGKSIHRLSPIITTDCSYSQLSLLQATVEALLLISMD